MPLRLAVALATLLLAACTSQPLKPDQRDPLEKLNRSMYTLNDGLDRAIARPVARTYRRITPAIVQTGVSNFWSNVNYPTTIVNEFLQGKPRAGLSDLARFLLNTVAGVGGLLDPATAAGLDRNDEDFGQTLGKWGVPAGPYLMLPLLGPSSIRDGTGRIADRYSDPVNYLEHWEWRYGLDGFRLLERRARLLPVTDTLQDVYDPYAFIRNAYFQQRDYAVHDGNVDAAPADEGLDLPDDDPPPQD
jgi:phospholipid-binding lipoprotein MlaA